RATIRSLENRAVLAAAPVQAKFGFSLAFRQAGKRREKSRGVFVSQKLTLLLNECAVTAAIGRVEPIDLRIGDPLRGLLSPLPRRVRLAGGFGIVACAVDR